MRTMILSIVIYIGRTYSRVGNTQITHIASIILNLRLIERIPRILHVNSINGHTFWDHLKKIGQLSFDRWTKTLCNFQSLRPRSNACKNNCKVVYSSFHFKMLLITSDTNLHPISENGTFQKRVYCSSLRDPLYIPRSQDPAAVNRFLPNLFLYTG